MMTLCYESYGQIGKVLQYKELPVPTAGPGQVLVKVDAAALNPLDYKVMAGHFNAVFPRTLPAVPGCEASGTVVAVGPAGVEAYSPHFVEGVEVPSTYPRVGDEVWADVTTEGGGMAEYVVVNVGAVAGKPSNLSHEEAASMPVAGTTALVALRDAAKLTKGESVLILGGAGGCGSLAVQIAKSLGASRVVTTASNSNAATLLSLGADEVVDYRQYIKWHERLAGQQFDVVLDCVGGRANWAAAKAEGGVLGPEGRFVTIAGDTKDPLGEPLTKTRLVKSALRLLGRKIRGRVVGQEYVSFYKTPSRSSLTDLKALVEAGKVVPVVDRVYPLSAEGGMDLFTRAMNRALGCNECSSSGKVVLSVDHEDLRIQKLAAEGQVREAETSPLSTPANPT